MAAEEQIPEERREKMTEAAQPAYSPGQITRFAERVGPDYRDHVLPEGKWEFDAEVTDVFEEMLERSIPGYHTMRSLVFALGSKFVEKKTDVVDLGCSNGLGLKPFVDRFGAYNRFVGVEVSEPMLEAFRARYQGYVESGIVHAMKVDLRTDFPPVSASLILSVLTVQFVPIEYRQAIIKRVFDHLRPGGAFVLVEKVLGETPLANSYQVEAYLDHKREMGYTEEEIHRKRLALEGVLVPITPRWNEDLLRNAGFAEVNCFWRHLCFAGWIGLKP